MDSQYIRRNWLFLCSLRRFARCHIDTISRWCNRCKLPPLGSCLYHATQPSPIGPVPFPDDECLRFLLRYNADTSRSCRHRILLMSYLPSCRNATLNWGATPVKVSEVAYPKRKGPVRELNKFS